MKKGLVVVLVISCMLLVSTGFSYPFGSYSLSSDWNKITTLDWSPDRQIYNIAYNENAATGHIYVNTGENIRIVAEATGDFVDTDFPTASSYDRLTSYTQAPPGLSASFYFSVGQADDGVIYATDLNRGQVLYRWASESATPTSQTVAGMDFARALRTTGSGAATKIYIVGAADYGPGEVLSTADGLTFTVLESIMEPTPQGGFGKSGVALKDATTAFGFEPWGRSVDGATTPTLQAKPCRFDRIAGVWTRSTAFLPPSHGDAMSRCLDGAWIEVAATDPRYPGNGLVFVEYYYPSPDYLWVLNDQTGAGEAGTDLQAVGTQYYAATYYGSCERDDGNDKFYYAYRGTTSGGGVGSWGGYGRLSVSYIGSGVSDWELY